MFVFPLAAAVLAAALAVACARLASAGGGGALWVWTAALAQFAVGSAALALGVASGWTPALYRTYYLFGAVTNVAWLGLGTVWLLAGRPVAWTATALVAIATAYAVAVVTLLPLAVGAPGALATETIPTGRTVMPPEARQLSRWFSISGSVVVLGGLAWSIVRERSRAPGLLSLAGGVAIVGVASELARQGFVAPFSIGLAVGVALMYAGFRRST